MANPMKTTLIIDETVKQRLREEAVRRGSTMSELVEAGLRHVLAVRDVSERGTDSPPPVPDWNSEGFPVDIADREELYRIMDEE